MYHAQQVQEQQVQVQVQVQVQEPQMQKPPSIYNERALALRKRRTSSPPPTTSMQIERIQNIKARNEMFRNRLNSLEEIISDINNGDYSSMDDRIMENLEDDQDDFDLQEPFKGSVFFAVTNDDLNTKYDTEEVESVDQLNRNTLLYLEEMFNMTHDELIEDDLQTTNYLIITELNNLFIEVQNADTQLMQVIQNKNMPFITDEEQMLRQQQHVLMVRQGLDKIQATYFI
jgi:hypothetical protein